jgi:hypothetical protein
MTLADGESFFLMRAEPGPGDDWISLYPYPAGRLDEMVDDADAEGELTTPRVVCKTTASRSSASMDEQGIPQVTNAELIAYLEAILLELRDRLNNYLDLGANDLIAADEGFNFTGQLQATLSDASEHATHVREQLIEIQRKGSE